MTPLRLGVIGMSPGNGHPYSWAAIFNGYDKEAMESCGFPTIPMYLNQQTFPEDCIAEARVTHVWAQDVERAKHIASAAHIDLVVNHYEDMVGEVDAVLLARDDAANHSKFATPFLDAGLPIYVDKPLALSEKDAEALIERQQYPGQLFSCSALRYAEEMRLDSTKKSEIGPVRYIHGVAPKSWDTYSPHLIEPLLCIVDHNDKVKSVRRCSGGEAVSLNIEFESGIYANLSTMGSANAPIAMRLFGEKGWCDLTFSNSFDAFKGALVEFIQGALHRDVRISPEAMLRVVALIEAGRQE